MSQVFIMLLRQKKNYLQLFVHTEFALEIIDWSSPVLNTYAV